MMEANKKQLLEEHKQLLKRLGEIETVIDSGVVRIKGLRNLLLLQRDAMRQYLDILTVRLDDALMAKIFADDIRPIHYAHCAICHKPIRLKGMSRIELSDTCGKTERVEGLCQECYLKFYNAIKGHGRGLV
jgi:hypothetical protein